MKTKREDILADPEAYRRQRIGGESGMTSTSFRRRAGRPPRQAGERSNLDRPSVLREDIARLSALITQALGLEAKGVGTKSRSFVVS